MNKNGVRVFKFGGKWLERMRKMK